MALESQVPNEIYVEQGVVWEKAVSKYDGFRITERAAYHPFLRYGEAHKDIPERMTGPLYSWDMESTVIGKSWSKIKIVRIVDIDHGCSLRVAQEKNMKNSFLIRSITASFSVCSASPSTERVAMRYLKKGSPVSKDNRNKWSKKGKIRYLAIILDESSRKDLIEWWLTNVGEILPHEVAHHSTLKFQPSIEEIEAWEEHLGKEVAMQVVGYGNRDNVQAVAVKYRNSPIKSNNTIEHVTVALRPPAKAHESNEILKKGIQDAPNRLTLTGRIGFFGRGKELYELAWDKEDKNPSPKEDDTSAMKKKYQG